MTSLPKSTWGFFGAVDLCRTDSTGQRIQHSYPLQASFAPFACFNFQGLMLQRKRASPTAQTDWQTPLPCLASR